MLILTVAAAHAKRECISKTRSGLVPVQHSGEYVLTADGSKDFGEISPDIARQIGRQAGKIRLRIGRQKDEPGDYGEVHIERPNRLAQLRFAGFDNARDFVAYTCGNFDEIYASGKRLILTKSDGGHTCVIELKSFDDGEFYDVETAMIARKSYLRKKNSALDETKGGVLKVNRRRCGRRAPGLRRTPLCTFFGPSLCFYYTAIFKKSQRPFARI